MKTQLIPRLENALTKLYNAFHNEELDSMDCRKCAVGNLCDNKSDWVGSMEIGKIIRISKTFDNKTGYSVEELMNIECLFISGNTAKERHSNCNRRFENGSPIMRQEDGNFLGLCEVVEYLCSLDNVPNVMDYTKLFETENDKPKYELSI